MRSASNRDVFQSRLQVLHVHVLLVAPLGAGYMSQSGTDQHQGRISIRERPHHTGPAADLPVQPFNHIVGADPCPMLIGEITVSQRFLDVVLHLPGSFLQLHFLQLSDYSPGLFPGSLLVFLCMDGLEHLGCKSHSRSEFQLAMP